MRFRLVLLSAFFLAACSSGPTKPSESAPVTKTETKAEPKDVQKKSAAANGEKIECKVTGDERTLEVRETGKGCELAYVKGGNEGIVATSANGKEHCVSVQNKIKERLEGAGFKCN
jgi:hypothetical protein